MTKATTPRIYADAVNQRYKVNKSNMVTLKDRWNQSLASLPIDVRNSVNSRLNYVISRFQKLHPEYTSWFSPNWTICEAVPLPGSWLCLDTTIQRVLNIDHVLNIIENFLIYQVMPIQVYPLNPVDVPEHWDQSHTYYASWDGQHTAIALWIITDMIFKEDMDKVKFPTVRYNMPNRGDGRMTFIANNGPLNKLGMDGYDLTSQMVYAVKLDGVELPEWKDVAEKQDLFDAYQLFFTDSKFGDHTQPGAFTRVKDVFKTPKDVLKDICIYVDQILTYQPRAVNTKEFPILQKFFTMARSSGIEYTEEEIRSLAELNWQLFRGDFDESGAFWSQVGVAYTNWHNDYHANWDENEKPNIRLNKDVPQGATFFWFQLKYRWQDAAGNPMRMPRLSIDTRFRPAVEDLF